MKGGVEKVDSFVYSGNKLNAGGGCLSTVAARLRVSWMKFRALSAVFCGRKCSMKMKEKVYRSCVRAAMVYSTETWVMKKVEEDVLLRAERELWLG